MLIISLNTSIRRDTAMIKDKISSLANLCNRYFNFELLLSLSFKISRSHIKLSTIYDLSNFVPDRLAPELRFRNFGLHTRIGNIPMSGGPQGIDSAQGILCNSSSTTPLVRYDHLHICGNGPLSGRYLTVYREPSHALQPPIEIAEIELWDRPQASDQSYRHGR